MKYQYKEMPESMSGTYGEFAKNFGFDWKEFIMGIPTPIQDISKGNIDVPKVIALLLPATVGTGSFALEEKQPVKEAVIVCLQALGIVMFFVAIFALFKA